MKRPENTFENILSGGLQVSAKDIFEVYRHTNPKLTAERLIVLAFFIASPIAWLIMNRWLQDFAYRIPIGWELFARSGGAGLFIALLTISFRAIKAALANPIKSLRTE